tara:strand:- start:389 stop:580 length:192 start_codon:yes stop_codon:yes gene_type:complete
MNLRFLRIGQVVAKTRLSKRTIYRWINQGRFPEQINYGNSRIVFWCEKTIDEWMAENMKIVNA